MTTPLLASIFSEPVGNQVALRAMPLLLAVLVILAIAYRYYSAFLAAKLAVLDDLKTTPAHTLNDGQNYHPTNKWVLFGHHFAAISGAGPLIGPVLAIQYGYMPGLLWLVIGVCLAGAVQDMLVLAASVRRQGKSLAEIARTELGPWANIIVSAAILFIVVIALAGLGFVIVKALGGEEVKMAEGTEIQLPLDASYQRVAGNSLRFRFPKGCTLQYPGSNMKSVRPEGFEIELSDNPRQFIVPGPLHQNDRRMNYQLPEGTVQLVPGSSWGVFTIACTIPIALFVGLYMYKIRKGKVLEASLIGAVGVLGATVAGNWIPGSPLEAWFSLSKGQTVFALTTYGFIASVLPVWLLLCPRDYLSSFLKIGTIALLVVGVLLANPVLPCPAFNHVFASGGPTFNGGVFPFVFICIMCGAISGFHALVASGTTPKMIDKESQIRPIGYGAMLIEGLVGVVALIAAASLDPKLYYEINVDLTRAADYQGKLDQLYDELGVGKEAGDKMHRLNVDAIHHLDVRQADLAQIEEMVGNEVAAGPNGRGRHPGSRHGPHLHRGPGTNRPAHRRICEILVPLRHHVRGPVHPDDDRHRHAHRPISLARDARQDPSQIGKNRLAAGSHTVHVGRDGRVGCADLYRVDRHDLAHVRHRQSAPVRARPVHRHDTADQQRPGQVRAGDAAAHALRADDNDVGGRADGAEFCRHGLQLPGERNPQSRPDVVRDGGGKFVAAVGREPLAGGVGRHGEGASGRRMHTREVIYQPGAQATGRLSRRLRSGLV